MAYDDLPLEHARAGPDGPGTPSRPSILRWILVVVVAMATGGLLTFWWMNRTRPEPASPAPIPATDVPITANRPVAAELVLPPLADSDTFLRDLVAALSNHPMLARLLATRDLVRSATLAVVQIGDGKTPASPLSALRPATRVEVAGVPAPDSPTGRVNPESYARWNGAVAALVSVDPADAAQFYVNVKSLFDEAHRELGQGDDFDAAIVAAILMLAATPEPAGDPLLLRRPGYLEHDDARLRSLRPVQKQFLLVGPDNRRQVLGWLRQVARRLDLRVQ
ncbi:MAG TPA: DUF3014 domain-containing protein [Vicinamibacterales bacterium]|nr:DUF3014 domain-containing protein [Vicinamibacterales bacterium]